MEWSAAFVRSKSTRMRVRRNARGKAGYILGETVRVYRMILDSMTANSIREVSRVLLDMRMESSTGHGPA